MINKTYNAKTMRIRISTTIPLSLHQYAKEEQHLMFSRLLESAILIHKNAFEKGIKEDYYKHLQNRIDVMREELEKATMFLNKHNLLNEFHESKGLNTTTTT